MTDPALLATLPRALLGDPVTGPLVGMLLLAAVIDHRTMRIPNWLTVSGAVYAFIVHAWQAPVGGEGLLLAGGGLLAALGLLLPLWLLRALGAGDVKLVAMVGAFLGPGPVIPVLLLTFVAGGAFALLQIAAANSWSRLAVNLRFIAISIFAPTGVSLRDGLRVGTQSTGRLPYAAAICAGTVAFLLLRQFATA